MSNSILFEPIKIGNTVIKNSRFVVPAMNGHDVDDHMFKERGIRYFRERAKGLFGLIVTEWISINEDELGSLGEAGAWDDKFIPSLKNLADAMHEEGSVIVGQLHNAGMKSKSNNKDFVPKAVSRTAVGGKFFEAYTVEEIRKITADFISAAVRLKKAGFDGCELHGAHGYLLEQFLSKKINHRIDEYGGSYEARFKIVKDIIEGIKKECGKDFIVGMKINAYNTQNPFDSGDDNNLNDTCTFLQMGEKAGLDYVMVSHRGIILPYFEDPGFNAEATATIKKHLHIPVIYVGRINDGPIAEKIVSSGQADLIALGRQSICDPYFPKKLKDGDTDLIFKCIGCQQRCSPDVGCEEDDKGSSCMINPFTNKEGRWEITPCEVKKHIAIIGAGCAGLQCAWVLAKRGHDVTVYEAKDYVGGNMIPAAMPPKKWGMAQAVKTEYAHCQKYGVKFEMNHKVSQGELEVFNYDVVINATGSVPFKPHIEGIDDLPFAEDVLLSKVLFEKKKVCVLGGGLVGVETAEVLLNQGNNVTIVEMKDKLAEEANMMIRGRLLAKIEGKVDAHLNTKISKIVDKNIYVVKDDKEINLGQFDEIVCALGYKSTNELKTKEEYTIGDAKQARNAKMAIYEATKLALNI